MSDNKIHHDKRSGCVSMQNDSTEISHSRSTEKVIKSGSTNVITAIASERRLGIDELHLALGAHSIEPNGQQTKNAIDISQYIIKIENQLKTALENNEVLAIKNEELAKGLEIETADKEKEKGKRLVLEDKLRLEKVKSLEEEKLRVILQQELKQQTEKVERLEGKCEDLERKVQINENRYRIKLGVVTNMFTVEERGKKKCELKLKDMYLENNALRNVIAAKDGELDTQNKRMIILRKIEDGRKFDIKEYEDERNVDLEKLSALLYKLKHKTRPIFEGLRRSPSPKQCMINSCIIAVNRRMGCCP